MKKLIKETEYKTDNKGKIVLEFGEWGNKTPVVMYESYYIIEEDGEKKEAYLLEEYEAKENNYLPTGFDDVDAWRLDGYNDQEIMELMRDNVNERCSFYLQP